MSLLTKLFKSENKIEMFLFIFNSAEGEPFRQENYVIGKKEKKIEFFLLKQSKYHYHLMQMKQYVVWSFYDNIYRVFVDENYYEQFALLYHKEINIIYMQFLYEILKKRFNIIKKNFFYLFLGFFISLIFYILSFIVANNKNPLIMFVPFVFFIFFLFFVIKKDHKFFKKYKKKMWIQTMQKIKSFLGEEVFNDISEKQKVYKPLLQVKNEKE